MTDAPEHVRLPSADAEIIDRALTIERLAGREVVLLTYGSAQASRARDAGLVYRKLREPLGPQPGP